MLNWIFNKKERVHLDLSRIGIDIHSHLIPGIDDGVQTISEAVSMLREMQSLGYSHIVTTPHIMWDCYKNTPENILTGLQDIRKACEDEGLTIHIDAAAEYFIDEHFNELLNSSAPLLTLPGKRLLIELPYSTPLMNTPETLFSIIAKGYQPVLAHPERYTYFFSDPSIYKRLADGGCELQVNILSLSGYYGANIANMAKWLLKNDLITFLGTDAHRIQHVDMIQKLNSDNWILTYPFQNEKLINI
ncbi:tyrosine-protein phosphatase [Dyadobacter arcticus]|uniref:protein-tyrosine-phosphatase n=1 Tax=Dyadobacter arcticus TaxID=1078754 RepID=A0ABX0UPR0_9BACT|nr:CpsB/CapC family capsule biosynthesis tyrosine phosphatase [Dyadobacter arcticus]NIJ54983.1 tyrosine-protein phosphatase YwqE [Dyadobacter arcticus]